MCRLVPPGRAPRHTAIRIRRAWRTLIPWHPFLAAALLFVCLSPLLGALVGWQGPVKVPGRAFRYMFIFGPVLYPAWVLCWVQEMRGADRAARGTLPLWRLGPQAFRPSVVRMTPLTARLFVVVLTGILVARTFSGWRVAIPTLHPFSWDRTLDSWDVALAGGERPWRIVHRWLAHEAVAGWLPNLLDITYSRVWYLTNVLLIGLAAIGRPGPRSGRVLLAYVLQFAVLGSLAAIIFSSAGPIYFGRVLGLAPAADPYLPLSYSLAAQLGTDGPFTALVYQALLWQKYLNHDMLSTGITAFPSLHVASATLFALAAGAWRWWAGLVGWAFTVLTLIGSVYFGWHYAVDGYASILATFALWWFAGRVVPPARRAPTGCEKPKSIEDDTEIADACSDRVVASPRIAVWC